MDLVLVTGAGATRELGSNSQPVPLMGEWSTRLCEALDKAEAGLASAVGLNPGMSGPEFEEALGMLLRWQEVRPLARRFMGLGGPSAGSHTGEVPASYDREDARLNEVMGVLNASLYDEFGKNRIDTQAVESAYGGLLELLDGPTLVACVTTNYDLALETGLEALGHEFDTGFVRPSVGSSPILEPTGIVERASDGKIPVLHLHGAVGWYEREGSVIEHYADQPFNPTLGAPAVLYPDPLKDPTSNATVQSLWDEFDRALDNASHVLVIGHSLHDPALEQRLNSMAKGARVGICAHLESGGGTGSKAFKEKEQHIHAKVHRATVFPSHFAPDPRVGGQFNKWRA